MALGQVIHPANIGFSLGGYKSRMVTNCSNYNHGRNLPKPLVSCHFLPKPNWPDDAGTQGCQGQHLHGHRQCPILVVALALTPPDQQVFLLE